MTIFQYIAWGVVVSLIMVGAICGFLNREDDESRWMGLGVGLGCAFLLGLVTFVIAVGRGIFG